MEGPPSGPPMGYPHGSMPLPPQSSYYPHLPVQVSHQDPNAVPPHMAPEHGGGYPVQPPPPGFSIAPYSTAYFPVTAAASNNTRKKGHRASQACEKCRERKSKCDENRPTCQGCRDQNIECVYRDNIPSKVVDKNMSPIMNEISETLSRWNGNSDDIVSKLVDLGKALADMEKVQKEDVATPLEKMFGMIQRMHERMMPGESRDEETSRRDSPIPDSGMKSESFSTEVAKSFDRMSSHSQVATASPLTSQERPKRQEGQSVDPDGPPVFEDHVTAAHKLLHFWPSINQMINAIAPKTDYVLYGEARGLIHLYGRGEAGRPVPTLPTYGTMLSDGAKREDTADTSESPYLWDDEDDSPQTDFRKAEGFAETQPLDLRDDTVWKLIDLYKTHIHDLHPFIDMPTLKRFLQGFVERHKQCGGGPSSPYATVNGDTNRKKRKRSEPFVNGIAESPAQHSTPNSSQSNSDVSLSAAIVYFALALGRVVEWQDILPGPVPPSAATASIPAARGLFAGSPSAASKPSPTSSWGAPTPSSLDGRGVAQSPGLPFDSPLPPMSHPRGNNVDEIPGLGYYREGCRIIGLHNDSNDIRNAQARLLAGLYKGQLGRIQESWSWISDACRICRYQIKMHKIDGRADPIYPIKTKRGIEENTTLITCWSALQLESDILAELDYPHSAIASYNMRYPCVTGVLEAGRKDLPLNYYNLQLFLRKALNEMHSNVYGKTLPSMKLSQLAKILESNEVNLDSFRITYKWNDAEPPAEDILEARLRAKFYGARYISLRPYLDYVLHAMRAGGAPESCAKDAYGRPRNNEMKLYAAIATRSKDFINERAKRCVESAILSTEAFDRVPGRLIVTSIVGTSHAQFSNMLVLSAAYNSGTQALRDLIPAPRLKALLLRTIRFIGRLRYCSPTAEHDVKILRAIYQYLFDEHMDDAEAKAIHGSFTSDASGAESIVST